jgi:hypothetical protein
LPPARITPENLITSASHPLAAKKQQAIGTRRADGFFMTYNLEDYFFK